MAAAEDRQAKALEGIQYHLKELVKVMATMNANFMIVGTAFKEAIEKEEVRSHENQPELPMEIDEDKNKFARLPTEFDEHFKRGEGSE